MIRLDPNREKFEHSFYTKEKELRQFFKGDLTIEVDCEKCVLEELDLKYPKMLLVVLADKITRYFVLDKKNELLFIPLSDNKTNIIDYGYTDLIHLNKVKNFSFHRYVSKRGNKYVVAQEGMLQEIILGSKAPPGYKNDHCNSNGMDNRSVNLRCIENNSNSVNIKPREDGKFRGISASNGKWKASIKKDKIYYYLGTFELPEQAARQYDIFSVHLFPGIKYYFNQINGKDSLSRDEIEEIIANPEKYKLMLEAFGKQKRDLPDCIFKNTVGTLSYQKTLTKVFGNEKICQDYLLALQTKFPNIKSLSKVEIKTTDNGYSFNVILSKNNKDQNILEELSEDVDNFVADLDEKILQKLRDDIDNHRKENGDAFIRVYKGADKSYYDMVMDDEDWIKYCSMFFNDSDGYPRNAALGSIHTHIFKTRKPEEYANRKPGESVDHINSEEKWNVKLENLRLASRSLQAQNKKLQKKSLTMYTGVELSNGKFHAVYKKKCSKRFETLEEAAREYNKMALEADPRSRVNVIDTENTTAKDIYGKENLKFIFNEIVTVKEIKEIIRINGWKTKMGITRMVEINAKNLKKYKNLIEEILRSED